MWRGLYSSTESSDAADCRGSMPPCGLRAMCASRSCSFLVKISSDCPDDERMPCPQWPAYSQTPPRRRTACVDERCDHGKKPYTKASLSYWAHNNIAVSIYLSAYNATVLLSRFYMLVVLVVCRHPLSVRRPGTWPSMTISESLYNSLYNRNLVSGFFCFGSTYQQIFNEVLLTAEGITSYNCKRLQPTRWTQWRQFAPITLESFPRELFRGQNIFDVL